MATVLSVKHKQFSSSSSNNESMSAGRIGMFAAVPCKGRGFVVALCMVVCADEGPDLLCLLFFLVSLVGSCLD